MTTRLRIVTCNIHKGFSQFNRHLVVHDLKEHLHQIGADIAFLQEVQGAHHQHAISVANWPETPQHSFIAEGFWPTHAYGANVYYPQGHHGNAILTRLPLLHSHNQDVTHLRFEKRGILHCTMELPGAIGTVHCVCVHLSLFGISRRKQLDALAKHLENSVPSSARLIIAGDFNDWRNKAAQLLADRLGLSEVMGKQHNNSLPGKSFPAQHPLLRLDRIYVRGFNIREAKIHTGLPWSKLSDHAPLSASLTPVL